MKLRTRRIQKLIEAHPRNRNWTVHVCWDIYGRCKPCKGHTCIYIIFPILGRNRILILINIYASYQWPQMTKATPVDTRALYFNYNGKCWPCNIQLSFIQLQLTMHGHVASRQLLYPLVPSRRLLVHFPHKFAHK